MPPHPLWGPGPGAWLWGRLRGRCWTWSVARPWSSGRRCAAPTRSLYSVMSTLACTGAEEAMDDSLSAAFTLMLGDMAVCAEASCETSIGLLSACTGRLNQHHDEMNRLGLEVGHLDLALAHLKRALDAHRGGGRAGTCLLYTSDAAEE